MFRAKPETALSKTIEVISVGRVPFPSHLYLGELEKSNLQDSFSSPELRPQPPLQGCF
jgi:hypothetical protein